MTASVVSCVQHSVNGLCTSQMFAVPTGSEVKVYKRDSWDCIFTLSDLNYHTEVGGCGHQWVWPIHVGIIATIFQWVWLYMLVSVCLNPLHVYKWFLYFGKRNHFCGCGHQCGCNYLCEFDHCVVICSGCGQLCGCGCTDHNYMY